METTIIKRKIYLEPKFIDQNIMDHLLTTMIKKSECVCTFEFGHIISIERILEIVDTDELFFWVRYETKTLKPKVGDIFSASVCMIFKEGIFVDVEKKQKILIPTRTLKNYKFEEGSYVNGEEKIKQNGSISVLVSAVHYDKERKNFRFVGELI